MSLPVFVPDSVRRETTWQQFLVVLTVLALLIMAFRFGPDLVQAAATVLAVVVTTLTPRRCVACQIEEATR